MQHCHQKPRYNDGNTTHSFCSRSCAQQAKAAGPARRISVAFSKSVRSRFDLVNGMLTALLSSLVLTNGCLLCGNAVKKGHFCSRACALTVEKNAPQLIEVPNGHDTFKSGML